MAASPSNRMPSAARASTGVSVRVESVHRKQALTRPAVVRTRHALGH